MRIVVLVPTYNEKENIEKLIKETFLLVNKLTPHKFFVLIVDDNSPDGTWNVVETMQKRYKNLFLLKGTRKGLGYAMLRGYSYAIQKLNADVVVSNEADFAFETNKIIFMIRKIEEGWDVVVGSRHVGDGKTEGWTVNRRLNHWVANKFFATWIAGVNEVNDHNGAFRAIRVKGILDKIDLGKINVVGFGFFFYFLYRLTLITKKFYEFPVVYRFRKSGESKVSFNPRYIRFYTRDVLEYTKLAFSIRLEKSFNL